MIRVQRFDVKVIPKIVIKFPSNKQNSEHFLYPLIVFLFQFS